MNRESINREVENTKKTLESPLLKCAERHALEMYLISLTKENAE